MNHKNYIEMAIKIAINNIDKGGGPFGAVIVKDGKIISTSGNSVTNDMDPTAHAEVNAIRKACKKLKTFDLSGCEIYASCEPCPMCLGAIYWARLDALYFAADKHDAASVDFSDAFIYEELEKPIIKRNLKTTHLNVDSKYLPFKKWLETKDKKPY
ncbi:MAG: nucleoside deaminase [Bacteroidales bacterium]|nr:nucleoside deaminase [Bacteroidales bacterium]